MRGQYLERDGEKLMLFDLSEPEITVREESEEENVAEVVSETETQDKSQRSRAKIITLYPLSWTDRYGDEADKIHLLERIKYSGNWDVLRPTKAVENVQDFTREKVDALTDKARELIDRMRKAV